MNNEMSLKQNLAMQIDDKTAAHIVRDELHRIPRFSEYDSNREPNSIVVDLGDDEYHMVTLQQVQWFLEHDRWEQEVITTCGVHNCIKHIGLNGVSGPTEEELLQLVERNSVSLADLYRKGRQRGLISARSSGYGA